MHRPLMPWMLGWGVSFAACAVGTGSVFAEEPPPWVIQVCHGGGHEPLPHKQIISVSAVGRVEKGEAVRHKTPAEVAELMEKIRQTDLFDLTQEQFDQKLRDAGEFEKSLRGGSGVYTITAWLDGKTKSLRLNRPETYEKSAVPAAKNFLKVLRLVQQFAGEKPVDQG